MPSRPRRPAPRLSAPPILRALPPAHPPDAAAHQLTVSARTPLEAAHGALRDALLDLGRPARDAEAAWEDDARPPAAGDASEARGGARDRVNAAAGVYARALRRDRVGLPAALVAVRATVAQDAAFLPVEVFAGVQRDAAQCCLEAFYAH